MEERGGARAESKPQHPDHQARWRRRRGDLAGILVASVNVGSSIAGSRVSLHVSVGIGVR